MAKPSITLQQLLDAYPEAEIIVISRAQLAKIQKQILIIEQVALGLLCQIRDQEAQKAALTGDPGID